MSAGQVERDQLEVEPELNLGFHIICDWSLNIFDYNGRVYQYPEKKITMVYEGLGFELKQSYQEDFYRDMEQISAVDLRITSGTRVLLNKWRCGKLDIRFDMDRRRFTVRHINTYRYSGMFGQVEEVVDIVQDWLVVQ